MKGMKKKRAHFRKMCHIRKMFVLRSDLHGFDPIPRGAGESADAGIALAEEDSATQGSGCQDFAAFGGRERTGGGRFDYEGLHVAVLVTNHATMGLCGCFRDEEAARVVYVFQRGPEKAAAGLVVAGIGVAAVAAAVAEDRPTKFFHNPAGCGGKLTGGGGGYLHLRTVNGLLQLLKLVAAAVGTCKRDIHG